MVKMFHLTCIAMQQRLILSTNKLKIIIAQRDFCNLPGFTKLITNEQDVAVRTCKKVEYFPSKLYENKRID